MHSLPQAPTRRVIIIVEERSVRHERARPQIVQIERSLAPFPPQTLYLSFSLLAFISLSPWTRGRSRPFLFSNNARAFVFIAKCREYSIVRNSKGCIARKRCSRSGLPRSRWKNSTLSVYRRLVAVYGTNCAYRFRERVSFLPGKVSGARDCESLINPVDIVTLWFIRCSDLSRFSITL